MSDMKVNPLGVSLYTKQVHLIGDLIDTIARMAKKIFIGTSYSTLPFRECKGQSIRSYEMDDNDE